MTLLKPFLACAICVGLAACDNWSTRKGVGFTGIDGEPRMLEQADGVPVTRGVSTPIALARRPMIHVQTAAAPVADLAGVAIGAGGQSDLDAVAVSGAQSTLMLSLVNVSGQPFAVLRPAEGERSRMEQGAQARFPASVLRLTGCRAVGAAYAAGGTQRPTGLAVPVDCR